MKKYFNTPKMPLSFYITDLTIYYILILIIPSVLREDAFTVGNLVGMLFFIGFIALQSYTWAWFCDYMLFSSGDNVLVQFMFRPFGISKRMAATAAMVSFVIDREYKITDDYKVVRDYSSNFRSLGCMALLFLLPRLALSTAIAPWTILFHPFIMKKYEKAIEQEIEKINGFN